MKHTHHILFLIILGFFIVEPSNVIANTFSLQNNSGDTISKAKTDKFDGWTEEQYKHYEDSIISKLYPPVVSRRSEEPPSTSVTHDNAIMYSNMSVQNPHVPNTINIDKSKEVGEISINSGTLPSGAKTYEIPISVSPGMKGFTPNISLVYNSQQGNSTLGMGWSVSGISMIVRGGKSIYYDGKAEGIKMDNNDSFMLNGVRLIKTDATSGYILYESEQGNIKAKGFISGTTMTYFEVFFPNGDKGVFGSTMNFQNMLFYPLFSLEDLYGNTIRYAYTYSDNHYTISRISYNGCYVDFQYAESREDPILTYGGGKRVYEPKLLKAITSKHGAKILCTYTLSYSVDKKKSFLTRVDLSANGKSFNPIFFYYGEGLTATSYTKSETQLLEWYESDAPNMIKVVKGKFDYDSDADGLIVLPNKNPYWKHYRHSTAFRHSQNRFDNLYLGDEKIFLYAGLKDNLASPMPNLLTESGFVDIISGDLEGKQEEYVIKINDLVVNNNDQITFKVYRSNLYSGLARLYTRNYSFPTVYTDADDGKSIQPKYYYAGDFNGDGKMEVLATSVHQPFGDTGKPSKCYVFDLVNDKILYQSHVFPFNIDFVGVQQSDSDAANNNSDKLLVMDYDGDGKTDICHINDNGVDVYTFETSGTNIVGAKKIASYTGLNKAALENRRLLMGEFNGDGLIDLLVSPSSQGADSKWTVYNSKGNGQFDKSTFSGTNNDNSANAGFVIQDVNSDGTTDLIKYSASGFFTYLASNNKIDVCTDYCNYPSTNSILVPTNINSRNSFTQLISLKEGKATKYSFSSDYGKESLLTGVANSLGVIEKNYYTRANEEGITSGVYSKGYGATYPYVNIHEPLTLIASSETYVDGKTTEGNTYRYKNAVVHRQGLGFCGFEEIMSYDNRGRSSVCVYDTNRRGIVKSKSTPTYKGEYEYSVTTQTNRLLKILLTKKTETDLLKNIKVATSYSYDTYGYPTEEGVTYSDGTTIMKNTLYSQRNTIGDGYYLGFPINKTSAITREGTTYTERIFIPAYSHRQPNVRILYKNGNAVKEETFSYDSYGNVINSSVKDFSSTSRQTTKYEYNLYGRPTKTTSPMGLVTRFGYDDFGRVKTMSDFRGGVTSYSYDGFGRETSVSYPDNTHKSITLSWETDGSNGIYRRTQETTGLPKSAIVFDALNRDVCTSKTLLNGKEQVVLKEYDNDGHLSGITNPYDKSVSPFWKSYAYDIYGRVTSCTESSTAVTKYEYNGNSITTTSKGITQTQAYDALGNLISVTDSAGTITYQIAPDGNPVSITAPGNIKTTFGYDKYRRRISLADPSMGVTTYEYDASGNLSKETDANGNAKQYEYDQYNRLLKSTCPEFTTSYNYNTVGDLVEVSTSNGTGSTISYDVFGRIKQWKQTIQDGKWLQKDYTYADGNVSSIEYTSQAGQIAKENYVYVDGCLKEVNLNGTTNVYSIATLSSHGTASSIVSGSITRKYQYTPAGLLNERSGTSHNKKYQDFSYTFNVHTLNMMARKDNLRNLTEDFKYDNLNRLMSFGDNSTTYDSKGNITSQSDVGSFDYDIPQKPYAVSGVTLTSENMPVCNQEVEYTSFSRPKSISENGYIADFSYFADYERTKMAISHDNNNVITRYYMGDCYELEVTPTGNKERLYLGGDYYSAPAVLVKENGVDKVYNVLRDNLGSITHIIAPDDSLVQELSYDAWGRLRDPATLQVFDSGNEPELFLGRGYTGHEHLTQFGLINMNARLYDAALGRFLSPDPYVQMPDFSQNFNRYSYCMNNPLKYVDKDGKSFLLIAAIVAGAYFGGSAINGTFNPTKWNYGSWKTYAGMAVGGVAGYAGAALGTSVAAAATASGASSIGAGMAGGMIGGMTSGAINGAGMAAISGGSLDDVMEGMTFGTVIGGLGGAISGGIGSSIGDFSGVPGSSFKNAVYELGHSTLKGIATGIGGGIMMAAMEGRIDYLWQGVAWGAALSVGMAGLRIGLMGTTIVPPGIEGRFDADDNAMGIRITYPVYRRGGLLRNWVPGITIGRNMMVDTRFLNSDSKSMQSQYYEILAHERAHVYQQKILGRAGFYLRTMYEYLINPGYSNNKPYNNPNCLEYWAEQYMKLTP